MRRDKARSKVSASVAVDALRPGRKRAALHPRERLLIGLLGATAIIPVWVASWPVASTLSALILAASAFLVSLLPRPVIEGMDAVDWSNRWKLDRLVKFPVFWVGLLLMIFLALQWQNPAFRAVWDVEEGVWAQIPIEHREDWPVGVVGPLGEDATPRAFAAWVAAWLATCAVWVGITRRRSLVALLGIVAANAVVLGALGILHYYTGGQRVLFFLGLPEERAAASFGRAAPAAAYFILSLGLCLGMAVYHFFESRRQLSKSDPSGLFYVGAVLSVAMAAFSGSSIGFRISTLLVALYISAGVFFLIWRNAKGGSRVAGIAVSLLAGMVAGWGLFFYAGGGLFRGLNAVDRTAVGADPEIRAALGDAAREAIAERPWTGWGAGSFRYAISGREVPVAAFEDWPEIVYHDTARNDLVQMLTEIGRVGTLLALLCAGLLAWRLATPRILGNPLLFFTAAGIIAVLLLGTRETVLATPAVLVHFCMLLCACALLAHFEQSGRFRAPPSPLAPELKPWEKRGVKTVELG